MATQLDLALVQYLRHTVNIDLCKHNKQANLAVLK